MSENDAKLEEIRKRFETDQAFRQAAESDLEGTLLAAGLPAPLVGRFVVSDTDEHGNQGMGLRSQIWICEIDGDTKRCWCTNCPIG